MPLASVLSARGGWDLVFIVAAVVTIAAGIAAKLVVQPMRRKLISGQQQPVVQDRGYLVPDAD